MPRFAGDGSVFQSGDHHPRPRHRDFRRLLARAFSASEPNAEFIAVFAELYGESPALQNEMQSKEEFFLTTYKEKKGK